LHAFTARKYGRPEVNEQRQSDFDDDCPVSGTSPASPVIVQPLGDPAPPFRHLRKLTKLTDTILLKRTQLAHDEQSLVRGHEFLIQSTRELKSALNEFMHYRPGHPHDQIDDLYTKFCDDQLAVMQQYASVAKSRAEMNELEYKLVSKEQVLAELLSNLAGAQPDAASKAHDELAQLSEDTSEASSRSDTPSLLAKYFDKKGDVSIYKERLEELEAAFKDGQVQRDFIADRGDPLDLSDEQYLASFAAKRDEILRDLAVAERDSEQLALQCGKVGLSTGVHRTARSIIDGDTEVVTRPSGSAAPRSHRTGKSAALVQEWLDDLDWAKQSLHDPNAQAVGASETPELGAMYTQTSKHTATVENLGRESQADRMLAQAGVLPQTAHPDTLRTSRREPAMFAIRPPVKGIRRELSRRSHSEPPRLGQRDQSQRLTE